MEILVYWINWEHVPCCLNVNVSLFFINPIINPLEILISQKEGPLFRTFNVSGPYPPRSREGETGTIILRKMEPSELVKIQVKLSGSR